MSKKEKIKKYEEAEKAASTDDGKLNIAKGKESEEKEPADLVERLEEKLLVAETASKDNYDRLLRVSAEFENFKKRTSREMDELRKFSNESILKELLPVVDNLERAISSASEADGSSQGVIKGVEMTQREILKVFSQFGVKPIEAIGQPFDPIYHQAIMQEETDEKPENTVTKEMQRGYLIHDRLLRPSMVVVSKPTQVAPGAEDGQDNISNED